MELTTDDRKALQGAIRVLVEILQQSPPEVPDTIHEWPTNDKHLRGDCWECSRGSIISYRDGGWHWWDHVDHIWHRDAIPGETLPLTRVTDPSLPRTWGTLEDVPEDVERVTGDYVGMRRELARGELSGSGWFQRVLDEPFRRWVELSADRTKHVKNIRETS